MYIFWSVDDIVYKISAYLESFSNIVELFESVSTVLDTPSKKTLWMFILARLSPPHQQYCINQISLPRHILLGNYIILDLVSNVLHITPQNCQPLLDLTYNYARVSAPQSPQPFKYVQSYVIMSYHYSDKSFFLSSIPVLVCFNLAGHRLIHL